MASSKPFLAQEVDTDQSFDRSSFLRTAGSCALVIAMGLPIAGCSVTDSEGEEPTDTPATGDNGITVNGNVVTIDLTKSGGQPLASSGGWLVSSAAGIIALNIDGTLIRAFTNRCPHQGISNQWSYSNGTLVCNAHGSAFNNSGSVTNGPADADLTEYSVSRAGNIVTITK
ncbi:MAG: Rieske (2Fe-2S) protein [Bacteroidetes bacterium]|nr:Rieske (2Fe-2S) protein [Bacteroidota bacterium]